MKIAIQGHSFRFKEVIDILVNLGGINKYNYKGNYSKAYYYIDESNYITRKVISEIDIDSHKLYTLKEFKKEFPFKVGDKVTVITDTPYKIVALEYYMDRLCYKLDNGLNYSSNILTLYKEMKEERNITLTLDKAKEWYNKGGELKEIALQAFTEKELNSLPKSWEEYCKMYKVPAMIFGPCIPNKYTALWKLEQLRDCYRQGWKPTYCLYNSISWYRIYNLDRSLLTSTTTLPCFLSFQGETVAQEFLKNFESLIKEAGDLI